MAERERFFVDTMSTPLGDAVVVADETGALCMYRWTDPADNWRKELHRHRPGAELIAERDRCGNIAALERYYEGDIPALDTLRVVFSGTLFQKKVWNALRTIPGGTTLSYGALAARIGAPKAVRAVGLANGSNPIGVVVPCHRVIGSNGSLTGYGGGLERKRWLLAHEARHCTFRLEVSA